MTPSGNITIEVAEQGSILQLHQGYRLASPPKSFPQKSLLRERKKGPELAQNWDSSIFFESERTQPRNLNSSQGHKTARMFFGWMIFHTEDLLGEIFQAQHIFCFCLARKP